MALVWGALCGRGGFSDGRRGPHQRPPVEARPTSRGLSSRAPPFREDSRARGLQRASARPPVRRRSRSIRMSSRACARKAIALAAAAPTVDGGHITLLVLAREKAVGHRARRAELSLVNFGQSSGVGATASGLTYF